MSPRIELIFAIMARNLQVTRRQVDRIVAMFWRRKPQSPDDSAGGNPAAGGNGATAGERPGDRLPEPETRSTLDIRPQNDRRRIIPRSPRAALEPERLPEPPRRSAGARHPMVVAGNAVFTILIILAVVVGG